MGRGPRQICQSCVELPEISGGPGSRPCYHVTQSDGRGDCQDEQPCRRRKECCLVSQLAKLLAEFNHHKEAQQYLENAREADPDNIGTLSELSKVHMEFNDWAKAVEFDKECERLLTDPDKLDKFEMRKWEMHNCLERMSVSYQKMNQVDECLSMSKRAIECHPDCDTCFEMTLTLQHRNHQHEENIALLHMLAETKHFAFKYSSLAWLIMKTDNRLFVQYIAGSALATENLPFMVDCWRNAAKVALDENETVKAAQIDLDLARIYYEYTRNEPKAIRKWEKVLNMFPSAKGARRSHFMKLEASRMLATHFLSKAVMAGVGTPKAEEQIANLKSLIHRVNPTTSSPWLISGAAIIALGVYCRLDGQKEEALALFKPLVKRALDILSDDDPENDTDGLKRLIKVLLAAGDAPNVVAIAHTLGQYDDNNEPQRFEWKSWEDGSVIVCAGPCCDKRSVYDRMSQFPICFDMIFCEPCVTLLQEGKFNMNRCSTKHVEHFVHTPPRPLKLEADQMLVDGTIMTFSEWLDSLREKWDL